MTARLPGSGTGANTRFRSDPLCWTENEPPPSELEKPLAPLAAETLIVNRSAAKPRIEPPPVTRAIVQEYD